MKKTLNLILNFVLLLAISACGQSSVSNSTFSTDAWQSGDLSSFLEGAFSGYTQSSSGTEINYERALAVGNRELLKSVLSETLDYKELAGLETTNRNVGYFSATDYATKRYASCYFLTYDLGEMDVVKYFSLDSRAYDNFYVGAFESVDKPEMSKYNKIGNDYAILGGFTSEALQQKSSYYDDLGIIRSYSQGGTNYYYLKETTYKQSATICGIDGELRIGKTTYLTAVVDENEYGIVTDKDVQAEDYSIMFFFSNGENTYCISTYLAQRVNIINERYFSNNVFEITKPIIQQLLSKLA